MRKIIFNEETINQIKDYIAEGYTLDQVCNRFTIKYDTLRRVMFENNIEPYHTEKRNNLVRDLNDDDIAIICKLYSSTHCTIADICKETKLPDYVVQKVLENNFSQEYRDRRKSKICRKSKLGDKHPIHDKRGVETPQWINEIVDDGNGYNMIKKPNWYTGRKKSDYVFLHTVVMCEYLGITELPKGMIVHHIDFNKKNNDISNLALMTNSAHSKLHRQLHDLCKVQRLSKQE